MGADQKLLVVAALKCERLALQTTSQVLPANSFFATIGVGEKNARKNLNALIDKVRPSLILLFGTSGLINSQKNIKSGESFLIDLVVRWREGRGNVIEYESPSFAKNIFNGFPTASLVTVRKPVINDVAHEKLFNATQADLVDMETAAVCEVAIDRKIPLVILRVVSDNADNQAEKDWIKNLDTVLKIAAKKISPRLKDLVEVVADNFQMLKQEKENVHTAE